MDGIWGGTTYIIRGETELREKTVETGGAWTLPRLGGDGRAEARRCVEVLSISGGQGCLVPHVPVPSWRLQGCRQLPSARGHATIAKALAEQRVRRGGR